MFRISPGLSAAYLNRHANQIRQEVIIFDPQNSRAFGYRCITAPGSKEIQRAQAAVKILSSVSRTFTGE